MTWLKLRLAADYGLMVVLAIVLVYFIINGLASWLRPRKRP